MTRVVCPADHTRNEPCPVGGGIVLYAHDHDPVVLAASIKRRDAIEAACKEFAGHRDRLLRVFKTNPTAFRYEIGCYERRLDAAKDAAWATFARETFTPGDDELPRATTGGTRHGRRCECSDCDAVIERATEGE